MNQRLTELIGELLGDFGSTMKLCQGIVVQRDAPLLILDRYQRLHRIGSGIEIVVARWHHPGYGSEQRNRRRKQADVPYDADVRSLLMVGKNLSHVGRDRRLPMDHTAIKADRLAMLGKMVGKGSLRRWSRRPSMLELQSAIDALRRSRRSAERSSHSKAATPRPPCLRAAHRCSDGDPA